MFTLSVSLPPGDKIYRFWLRIEMNYRLKELLKTSLGTVIFNVCGNNRSILDIMMPYFVNLRT